MLSQVCVLLTMAVLSRCLGEDLIYRVQEGKSPGTYLGDIATDSRLMDSVPQQHHNLIRFNQIQQSDTSQLFRISKKTGKLYTAQTLDAETLCRHNKECFRYVKVAVRRLETFMSIMKIKVLIEDVNDHQPEFPEQQINIEFSEGDRKGMKKYIPNAYDKDVGELNSQITYQLKKKVNEPFTLSVSKSVDGTSKLGINLDDGLDREVKDSYMLQVIATDEGSPPKQSVLDVHITITDVNDNFPVFSQNVYNISIRNEDYDGLSPIATLSAKDLDSGKNGKISYGFNSKTSNTAKTYFKIHEITGGIFLQKKLPLGPEVTYELYVKATDEGEPPLSSIAMVLVNVINQQNNAPRIDVNFVSASTDNTAKISEDVEVGSFIAYVMVTDNDAGLNGEVNCDLHHDKFQLQSLGKKEYKVIVKNSVDRETEDHHEITINCQDRGSPPLHSESKFSILVIDVNDVRPQFSKETYRFQVYENQKSKIVVGSVNATDPDLGLGGKLTYSLQSNSKDFLPFQISENGLITAVMSLDHEFQDVYRFHVFVKDSGEPPLNNSVSIVIEVRDENDNAPFFTFPNINPFTMGFVYYPRRTKNITVLKATDSDSRENAFLKYEITSGNDKQLFAINHYTGLLSFNRVAMPEDAGSYDLEFVVKDSGNPVLSATTAIALKLTVSNKTTEKPNPVDMQSDDKIHFHLLIVIVLVAVLVSVPVTAAISVCYIRCNGRRNTQHICEENPCDKCECEQRSSMCSSYQTTYLPNAPIALTSDPSLPNNTLQNRSRRGGHNSGDDLCGDHHNDSHQGTQLQTAARDVIYEVGARMCLTRPSLSSS
ncbi:PCDHD1 [Acanthosepion pharaonis]|uniref:PCDHD1 n=1 Tax=Acanthosepion pharaonis TaxID=158019 RepID=A0A812DJY2_ACAPH|nr:PCDHD1 [Sepia pharaonis]